MLSQWCATHEFPMEYLDDRGNFQKWRVEGHVLCPAQRWHTIVHWDCCFTDDEAESWGCTCECHEGKRGRFGASWEDILELRARPEFVERLERIHRSRSEESGS
jgi:hypothetical protein